MVHGNKANFNIQNLISQPGIIEIFQALGQDSDSVRFIGGCVRDTLIDKSLTDIDIATIFTPKEVIEKLNSARIKSIPTGIKFGTVTAIIDKQHYEITTLRKDIECDGRHATVSFTNNWKEDAERRDFTINALSCSYEGEIFDYFNGLDDLKNNIVCFIGNPEQRIREDYLRILRFFRFSSFYSDNFDRQALEAIAKTADNLSKISGERIQAEMFKMLVSNKIAESLKIMGEINIFPYIGLSKINFDLFNNLLKAENMLSQKPNIILRLFLLGKENLNELIQRWRLSNKIKDELYFFQNTNFKLTPNLSLQEAKNIYFLIGRERFINLIVFGLAYNIYHIQYYESLLDIANKFIIPEFPIKGEDILSMGIQPGKEIGELLNKAKKYWIKSDYKADKVEILQYLNKP